MVVRVWVSAESDSGVNVNSDLPQNYCNGADLIINRKKRNLPILVATRYSIGRRKRRARAASITTIASLQSSDVNALHERGLTEAAGRGHMNRTLTRRVSGIETSTALQRYNVSGLSCHVRWRRPGKILEAFWKCDARRPGGD